MNKAELNNIAIDSLESSYIKNYLHSIKHEFTCIEQLTIIHNSRLTLGDKLDIYTEYLKEYADDIETKDKINKIIEEVKNVIHLVHAKETAITFYTDDMTDLMCTNSFDKVIDILSKCEYDQWHDQSITVYDLDTAQPIMYLELNKECNIIRYNLCYESLDIINKYVYIPNNLDIGDKVKVREYDGTLSNETYVVVNSSKLPDNLIEQADYLCDSSIVVVPLSIFDNTDNLKQKISDILHDRIERMNSEDLLENCDIITTYHDHIHLSLVEGV